MKINRDFFFQHVRQNLFEGTLKQRQVDGLTAILDYWEAKHEAKDDRWVAYLLGTTHHETGRTMAAIKEFGGDAYFTRRYDPPPTGQMASVARQLGNTTRGDGCKYCGRGFVQLTGRRNYGDWANRLGVDLIGDPTLAMDPKVATQILVEGSILGTFTGRKLSNYFAPGVADWRNARRIINGLDKADLVASYAKAYYAAISYTT